MKLLSSMVRLLSRCPLSNGKLGAIETAYVDLLIAKQQQGVLAEEGYQHHLRTLPVNQQLEILLLGGYQTLSIGMLCFINIYRSVKSQFLPRLPLLQIDELDHALEVLMKMITTASPFREKDPQHQDLLLVLLRIQLRRWFIRGDIGEMNMSYFTAVSMDSTRKISRIFSPSNIIEIISQMNDGPSPRLFAFAYSIEILTGEYIQADIQTLLYVCMDHNFAAGACLIYDVRGLTAAKADYLKTSVLLNRSRRDILPNLSVKETSRLLLGSEPQGLSTQ